MSEERQLDENLGRSRKLSQEEREQFLAEPRVGVLSVISDDDRPPATLPTWYAYQPGGNIAVVTRQGKRKSRLIRRAGKLSFSVQHPEVPYKYVTVEGTVVRQEPPTKEELASIGRRYLPADAVDEWAEWELSGGNGNGGPEYVEIRPDRWLTADFSR
ncbi:pyridoxamine 5'-phosphate oxidase family protein [Saccharopolyspora sp. K220]|uniref:pyridoxamine 5'-phosphate oxidase family protein n=1 Tax=Saccharopolyspora soli TaxID=2926618 RepID=UPI001F59FC3A|nr:pyridoxamine 5'-phosphate oxidase family protein [Saccharopolyspora soli]MCI2419197.1 pyridoxamine 5'-phosphate oxidase family protein [Saccharopolyspora soli]